MAKLTKKKMRYDLASNLYLQADVLCSELSSLRDVEPSLRDSHSLALKLRDALMDHINRINLKEI
jgi:hypothetical protein